MLSAGHILGSAQLLLTRLSDGASLLYTGDFKLQPGDASQPATTRHAQTLILETTYGLPQYRMPPREEVLAAMVKFAREAIEEGQVPMFGAYSLGKTQEILIALGRRAPELRFVLHPSASKMTKVYGDLGYPLPAWEPLKKETALTGTGAVVIAPPSAIRSQQLRKIKNRLTAMVSGWGLDPASRFRYQVDATFPLSDHADYDDLVRFVEEVNPERVLTLHGFATEFAADLRARGFDAWALTGANQMELFDAAPPTPSPRTATASPEPAGEGSWAAFCSVADRVAEVTGKLRKVEILAEYLASLPDEELPLAATFFTGRALGRTEDTRSLNLGWAIAKRALLEATTKTETEYRAAARGQNDGARTAYLLLQNATRPEPASLGHIRQLFEALAAARGPKPKTALLRDRLATLTPSEGRYVIAVLSRDLRIGLKEGLLEEALATAFDVEVAAVRRAHMLTGDLGQTAILARQKRLDEATVTPFVPLSCMLASPQETATAIWDRLGQSGEVWLEDKYDGIRAQLHRKGDRIELFSRDLRPLAAEFAELLEPARDLGADVILDGEIIAFAEGRRLTFFDLQKRLGRRHEGDLFLGQSVPVRFVAFDLIWLDGHSLLDQPLRERRAALESLNWAPPFECLPVHWARDAGEIDAEFKAARLRHNEGLIAKDPASAYSPGRRGLAWLKLKKPMPTLDCVVIKAEEGHGKRSHVLSDYTFAVQHEETGELLTIGKAYSGLTDAEIEELTGHFQEHTLRKRGRVHTVVPNIVLEIAFDSIQPSKRHNSGLALRFPRIAAIRRDKTPRDIDTLQTAQSLSRTLLPPQTS